MATGSLLVAVLARDDAIWAISSPDMERCASNGVTVETHRRRAASTSRGTGGMETRPASDAWRYSR